jgi:peptidoglycan/LPS O-acetylase OafA/YrhL
LFLGFTWSLAIEEQFYLLWPAIVYFFKKRTVIWIGAGMILNSILLRLILISPYFKAYNIEEFFYYGTITRFEGLVLGALIAIAFQDDGKWKQKLTRWAWPILGITLLLFFTFSISGEASPTSDNKLLTLWGYTLLALISGALIILIMTEPDRSIIRLAFGNKTMQFFGKYSYAMYMVHMPILITLMEIMWKTGRQNGWMWFLYIMISFGLTILLSLLSWNLLEKHMLKLKKYFE